VGKRPRRTSLDPRLRRIEASEPLTAAERQRADRHFKLLPAVLGQALRRGNLEAAVLRLVAIELPTPRYRAAATKAVRRAFIPLKRNLDLEVVDLRIAAATTPADDALPAWFSKLGRFFQLSAQLLAALTVALVFTRRGRWEALSERHLAIVLVPALLGVISGLVGSLPDVHRGLQALLLGYVVAAFVGVLTALGSTALDQGR
jgi:hypothetical protein